MFLHPVKWAHASSDNAGSKNGQRRKYYMCVSMCVACVTANQHLNIGKMRVQQRLTTKAARAIFTCEPGGCANIEILCV